MKIKSLVAALAASAIAVSAMAFSASAEVLKKTGNEKDKETYTIPVDGLDLSKLDKIVAEVSANSTKVTGCFVFNNNSGEAIQVEFESTEESGELTAEWATSDSLAGTVKDGLAVELRWVEPVSEGNDATLNLDSVKLLDKDGNELQKVETTATKATAAVTSTTAAKTTTSAKTGDAGVGIAVAALGLASAAAFVARKKH